jgi:hypothetical protein
MNIPFLKISGIFILILSIISAIFLKNLFLKFIGTAFIIIFFYLLIYYLIIYFYFRKNKIELLTLNGGDILPFNISKIEISGKYFPSFFPGIFFSISFSIYENNALYRKVISTINEIENNRIFIEINFDRHGRYIFKDFKFLFQDIFGLVKFHVNCEFEHELTVLPYFEKEVEIPFFIDQGGDQVIQTVTKVSSTDFFDTRKYYPGDDPRLINWKIFAHINELHIREVEKIPPKVGELSLLFAPYSDNIYEYEHISSIFFSTVYFLLKNNFELKILSPLSKNIISINNENEKDLTEIIFNSYRPFDLTNISSAKNPVVFASFLEYKKLLDTGLLTKNTYCKISYYESDEDKKSIINSFVKIKYFDNIFRELFYKSIEIKNKKNKLSLLKSKLDEAVSKGIHTEVYKTKNELFKEI